MVMGRPKAFDSPEQLSKLLDDYFIYCDELPRPYTVLSLCIFLKITRETLLQYAKLDNYSDTITCAKLRIEAYAEDCLYTAKNPTGIIFNLKNNWKWHDKQEIESSGSLDVSNKVDLTGYSVQQLKDMLKD